MNTKQDLTRILGDPEEFEASVKRVIGASQCEFGMLSGPSKRCQNKSTHITKTGYECCLAHAPRYCGSLRDDVQLINPEHSQPTEPINKEIP